MTRERTRRKILGLLGAGTVATLGGCTSVVDQVSKGDESTGTRQTTGRSTTARTTSRASTTDGTTTDTATADPETTGEPTDGTTQEGASAEEDAEGWSTESVTIESPDVSFASVPVPNRESEYARMGRDSATATATVYGNWKCPYTQEFVLSLLPTIVEEYVEPGHLAIEFRALAYRSGEPHLGPDAPRAARAGVAVWNADPSSYWSYFAHVFSNQPQERRAWAQPDLLHRFAEASGVSRADAVRRQVTNGSYERPVQRTVTAAHDLGIWSVPRVAVDGSVTAPTVDFEETRSQLEDAVRE